MNNTLASKLKYYCNIKQHNCLGKNIVEGMVPVRRGRGCPRRRWFQDIGRLNMTSEEVGILTRDRDSFLRAVMRATSL
jgi:hypothetical protein